MKHALIATVAAAPLCMAASAQAATITNWNLGNVVTVPDPVIPDTGVSVVYDRDPATAGAVTNGRVFFTPPEAVAPGLRVDNINYTTGGQNPTPLRGCIMSSNPNETCTGEPQTGKRFKHQVTGTGPTDFVFNVDPAAVDADLADAPYQVFHRLINQSGKALTGFTISLGFGVGDDFVLSGANDGLSFDPRFRAPGGSFGSSSQFPFGLFGNGGLDPVTGLPEDNRLRPDGFFDDARSGFNTILGEDVLTSNGFFGAYPSLFGAWLDQGDAPEGLLWDNDGDSSTDALVMAWDADGLDDDIYELRRKVTQQWDENGDPVFDANGDPVLTTESIDPFVGTTQEIIDELLRLAALDNLSLASLALLPERIEDVSNINVNYAILLGNGFQGTSFTLRVDVAPVPLPMAAPLLMAGLGGLALVGRRRKAQAAA